MIALIEIPHQRPARINWYGTAADIIEAANTAALGSGDDRDIATAQDAAQLLADDWRSYLLVESAADIESVEQYQGHQESKVRAMVAELRREFPAPERWFAFTAYNSQARYGYGTKAEADRYCDLINADREINVYSAEELDDTERLADLDSGADQSGFLIHEELDADGCLGLPD